MPQDAELISLGLFNLSVEAGQIGCALVLLLCAKLLQLIGTTSLKRVQIAGAYLIGIAGLVWTLERVAGTVL